MLLTLVLLPALAGAATWIAGDRGLRTTRWPALGSVTATLGVAVLVAVNEPTAALRWGGGLSLHLEVADISRAPIVLVAFVGLAVVLYSLGYGHDRGRARMVGLLVVFVGAMELLLLAGDFLTLLIAWELVGLVSWGLIGHDWRGGAAAPATQAFLATRAGDLGLFLAAGAAFAATGSLDFAALPVAEGGLAATITAGILVAATAKSAQLPFSPWLFSAMAGPTPASALLHSATMVAAGAYLLARLQPFLHTVGWFDPLAIGLGLTTALAGGIVAFVQPGAKQLLAASTSAHYGLMFVAVGAGYPAVAIAHLVAHALFKSLLFVSAGVAVEAAGTDRLAGLRVGRRLPTVAALTLVGTLALAAVPPLGGAWTKEKVVAAAGHEAPWIAVLVIVAGALSALYAARFQLVGFGPDPERSSTGRAEASFGAAPALVALAATSGALAVLWTPWGEDRVRSLTGAAVPSGATWELAASLATVAAAAYGAAVLDRRGRLAVPFVRPGGQAVADWFGLPTAARVAVVTPVMAGAALLARLDDAVVDKGVMAVARLGRWGSRRLSAADDRVVDAGVRGVARLAGWFAGVLDRVAELAIDGGLLGLARLTGAAGRDGRRLQAGQTHLYYAGIAAGTALLVTVAFLWS